MDSEKFKKALRMAVNVGCGFEGDAEDAASLLSLIETNEARIAELEAENAELKERVAMLDVTAVYKSLGEMGYIEQVTNLKAENAALQSRIIELEGLV